MKFGVLYEHQLPRPWDGAAELSVVQESLDQVALADRLGIDAAWAVEHHFLEEYAHCSAPEVFLAASPLSTVDWLRSRVGWSTRARGPRGIP